MSFDLDRIILKKENGLVLKQETKISVKKHMEASMENIKP